MNILFDAYWWFTGPPSGKNVVRSLALNWAAAHPEDQITLQLPKADKGRAEVGFLSQTYPNLKFSYTVAPQHALAALSTGALSSKYDVVLTQNFSPLGGPGLRCVFIHDLMFEEHPEWFTTVERGYLKVVTWAAHRAQEIFTSSLAESARIRRHLPRARAPITSVGLALSSDYANSNPVALNLLLPAGFLLTVGRINVRKNLETLVRSLVSGRLISATRPLLIVGAPDGAQGLTQALDAATADGSVIWTGSISDGELKWAYQHCDAFLFPSLDEGFGLPVLEALDAGAKIALSDIPAFREFGNVGVFFDPLNDADISDKVTRLLREPRRKPPVDPSLGSWEVVIASLRGRVVRK